MPLFDCSILSSTIRFSHVPCQKRPAFPLPRLQLVRGSFCVSAVWEFFLLLTQYNILLMEKFTASMQMNGAELSIETGRFATLADGAVMVRHGDTMVLVTAVASSKASDLDFMPLTVEYREKTASAGKIPGGFLKREGRPSDREILTSRLIDRPIRPMFPEGWNRETQIIATVFSYDLKYDSDTLAMVGASAALMLSSIPFNGPVSEVRICRKDGAFIANPTHEQLKDAEIDLTLAGTDESIVMVEGEGQEISEQLFIDAIAFGHEAVKQLNKLQHELFAQFHREKVIFEPKGRPQEIVDFVENAVRAGIAEQVRSISSKDERTSRRKALITETFTKASEVFTEEVIAEKFPDIKLERMVGDITSDVEYAEMREMILAENKRLDGRKSDQIRPISIEVGLLPRTHGSALFTRGETQSLGTITLGTKSDEQMIDGLLPKYDKTFILHYNFPPYSTNEVKRMMGVSRREIGHGNLAERSFYALLPDEDAFPYTMRIVSDVLMSNGSSSMATVCSASLAMFDAGVPLKKPVSGIAMGLIKEGDRVAILSDILGDEDHLGDMDFKVCGTADGITACQMDMKVQGISFDVITKALLQAKEGRMHILGKMNEVISGPRTELSEFAPRFTVIQIPTDTIGAVIGTGGETIRNLTKETNTEIEIEDDGKVRIAATSQADADRVIVMIQALTRKPQEGEIYEAKVADIREGLGAIMEFLPKTKGLLHISQLDHYRVENVSDLLKVGDRIQVKLVEIQPDGKFRLSRKALIQPPEGVEAEDYTRREPREGGYRGGGGRDGGGYRGGGGDRRGGGGGGGYGDDRRGGGGNNGGGGGYNR
jgi:polyribonucleotide nucleotidyltransferase